MNGFIDYMAGMSSIALFWMIFWTLFLALILRVISKGIFPIVTVREGQAGLNFIKGKLAGTRGPGRYRMIKGFRSMEIVDIRKTQLTISGQEVMTSDQIGLKISMIIAYQIKDPVKARIEVDVFADHLYTFAQQALRQVVAKHAIEELVEKRGEMGPQLLALVAPHAEAIGIEVSAVDVKDIMLPGDLRNAFAQAVRAKKEGQAAMEKVRAETAALRSLANAAKLVEDLPGLAKLRVLQTLEEIAKGHGNTFVMGVPDGFAQGVKPKSNNTSGATPSIE